MTSRTDNTETTSNEPTKVLTIEAVKRSIKELQRSHIHEQFIAYLHVRKQSIEQNTRIDIVPNWAEVSLLLEVDGGPPNKPHYLPFASRKKRDTSRYWLNPNIPGSFAPSSLRKASEFMIGTKPGKFNLTPNQASHALNGHLYGARQPVWPLAGYLLRNFSFHSSANDVDDLIDGFCELFRFDENGPGSDFNELFIIGNPPEIEWFEPFAETPETNDE